MKNCVLRSVEDKEPGECPNNIHNFPLALSVCIITKNDAVRLERCLESMKNFPIQVVAVDTGSTDNTMEMLSEWKKEGKSSFSLKTGTFTWIDDFAAAKNAAVLMADNDVVMVLDSDEYMVNTSVKDLEEALHLVSENKSRVGRIKRANIYERGGEECVNNEYISRVFSRSVYRYFGKVHEQLVRIDGNNSEPLLISLSVNINHDGYAGNEEERREKALRNIRLLKAMLSDSGDDPYVLYQLGKSCYMAGEYNEAAEYFDKALCFDVNPRLEWVVDMVETYGYALLNSNQSEKALALENIYDEFGNSADFKLLMGLIYMNNRRYEAAVNEFLEATKYNESRMQGANSYIAYYNAGVVMECLGYIEEAVLLYEKCGDYAKAKSRLDALKK